MLQDLTYLNGSVRYVGQISSKVPGAPITLDAPEETLVITDKVKTLGEIDIRVRNLIVLNSIHTPFDINIDYSGFFLNLGDIVCHDKTKIKPTYNTINQYILEQVQGAGVPLSIDNNGMLSLTAELPLNWNHSNRA